MKKKHYLGIKMNKRYYGYESKLHMEAAFERQRKLAELDDYESNVKKKEEKNATLDTDELSTIQCEQDRE